VITVTAVGCSKVEPQELIMRIADSLSYRHAESILTVEYREEKEEIIQVITSVGWVPKPELKERKRKRRIVARLDIDQVATNEIIERCFLELNWQIHPRIVSESESKLVADFKKGVIQVEVQFGNMARWYTDIFKFLLSYAADDIEVGVLIVPVKKIADRIDENIVYFERIARELPHAKMAVSIPVWLLGLE
jgi:hypothetical protein